MNDDLKSIKDRLNEARHLSLQMSYGRRAPAHESIPLFHSVIHELEECVMVDVSNIEAWRLLSEAHECLLDYRRALLCHQRIVRLAGVPSRKVLKRLAALREAAGFWQLLGLNSVTLRALGDYLADHLTELGQQPGDFPVAERWLASQGLDLADYLRRFRDLGAFSDAQLLENLVHA